MLYLDIDLPIRRVFEHTIYEPDNTVLPHIVLIPRVSCKHHSEPKYSSSSKVHMRTFAVKNPSIKDSNSITSGKATDTSHSPIGRSLSFITGSHQNLMEAPL